MQMKSTMVPTLRNLSPRLTVGTNLGESVDRSLHEPQS